MAWDIQPVDIDGAISVFYAAKNNRARQIAAQKEMERADRKEQRERDFDDAYGRFVGAGGLAAAFGGGRTPGRLIEQGAGPVRPSGVAGTFPGTAIGRGMKGVLESPEWSHGDNAPPPISAAPRPPADWKERLGPDGMAATPHPPIGGPGATSQDAPTGGPENLLPPEITRLANSPNMDDRNAAFIEMARIDPKRAFQIQSDARDASLDRLKGADEGLRIAASRLANTGDDASYRAVLADLDGLLTPLGIDLRKTVPATHPGPEGIRKLQMQALEMADQLSALDREARTEAMVENYDIDNARADREADSRIEDRRKRRGLAERREGRIASGRGRVGGRSAGDAPKVFKNGEVIRHKKTGQQMIYYNGEFRPL